MEQDYLIAGHRIRVEGDRLVQRIEALPGFPVFKTKSGGEPLCQFITTLNQAPVFEQVYYRSEIDGIVSRFGRYTDGYVFDMTFPDAEPLSILRATLHLYYYALPAGLRMEWLLLLSEQWLFIPVPFAIKVRLCSFWERVVQEKVRTPVCGAKT